MRSRVILVIAVALAAITFAVGRVMVEEAHGQSRQGMQPQTYTQSMISQNPVVQTCKIDAQGRVIYPNDRENYQCSYPAQPAILDCGMVNGVLVSKPCKQYAEELAKRLETLDVSHCPAIQIVAASNGLTSSGTRMDRERHQIVLVESPITVHCLSSWRVSGRSTNRQIVREELERRK